MSGRTTGGRADTAVRVLCNAEWFDGQRVGDRRVEVLRFADGRLWASWRSFVVALLSCRAGVFNISPRELALFCLLRKLFPAVACKIVSVDLVLARPTTTGGRVKARLQRWLLREVDLFLLYFRDTEGLCSVYGIDRGKIRYVPFKVNDFDNVLTAHPCDDGFILSCGRSKRDYATLCVAMEGLPFEARILAPVAREASQHGTECDVASLPPNVTMVHDDGSPGSWLEWIRRATFVVLPIVPDTLVASGISTYLVAMAARKCVIITDSAATRGLIDQGQAVIVPGADPVALRAAIVRVATDREYRERIAAAGCAYSRALGDSRRLAADIRREVEALLTPPRAR